MSQKQYKPHFDHLKNKWQSRQKDIQKSLWERHRESFEWLHNRYKHFMIGSLSSILMFAQPVASATINYSLQSTTALPVDKSVDSRTKFMQDISSLLPQAVDPLTDEQEFNIAQKLSEYFHLPITPSIDGKRLNRSYGYIGAEQHLMRYPGDTIDTHFDTEEEKAYRSSGMAPGRGAWGYFTQSREQMTEIDKQREKYYIAVQTFLAPEWNDSVREHYEFFKYRKMLVVNPDNGKAMVVVIGDAGPAQWTGKHLGGSPEVMAYLERKDGGQKGPVLYFFIDDKDNAVPLGPITIE